MVQDISAGSFSAPGSAEGGMITITDLLYLTFA